MNNKQIWTVAATGVAALGGAVLVYGALVESKRLVRESYDIALSDWPESLDGLTIGVLADFHIRDKYSLKVGKRAIAMMADANPDLIVLLGDFVGNWKPDSQTMLRELLSPLSAMGGSVIAIPGNHEYRNGDVAELAEVLSELDIMLLRNQSRVVKGVTWVGVDSYNAGKYDVAAAFNGVKTAPTICLWHEPDVVGLLPKGVASLVLSGHSHGGQFLFPGGIAPMTSKNGKRYRDGFYADAPTPLFVTRGVGTTGPPSRFLCPPQVAVLTIHSATGSKKDQPDRRSVQ